jgi:hypothetical protein
VRAFELATHLARGESDATPGIAEWLVETVHADAAPAWIVEVLAAAAVAQHAAGSHEQARALLAEIEQTARAPETTYYARQLPAMLRTARRRRSRARQAARRRGRAPPPAQRARPLHRPRPAGRNRRRAGRGCRALRQGGRAWREFGNVPEQAHALLGRRRCLAKLGRPDAEAPLREARELFSSIGYKPALAQTEALLEQATAASS